MLAEPTRPDDERRVADPSDRSEPREVQPARPVSDANDHRAMPGTGADPACPGDRDAIHRDVATRQDPLGA